MGFHENLHDLATKEGLKGRKLHKAVESFTWNITILKVRLPAPGAAQHDIFIYFFCALRGTSRDTMINLFVRPEVLVLNTKTH